MLFGALKLLNRIKDTLSKFSADKMVHTDLQIFSKSSHPFDIKQYLKLGGKKISSMQQTVQKVYKTSVKAEANRKIKIKKKIKSWKRIIRLTEQSEPIRKTVHILDSLEFASNDKQILTGVEALTALLKEYPEARHKAVQHGALRFLLRKGLSVTDELTKGSIRETLTVLGYTNPVAGRGIRILSIDGGGIRGVLVLEMLKKLEELTGKKIYELFDIFCGVSTGAVLTYSIGAQFQSLDFIIKRYEELSQEIFNQSPIWGAGNLVWSHGYYSTELWEQRLKDQLGNDSLISTSRNPQCPKICVVATLVNENEVSPYLFRNYTFPWQISSQYEGTFDADVWQAARASAAAPIYFEEFRLRDLILQDGGITVNNPTAVALHEAKLLWPNTSIQCIASFGTGRVVSSKTELVDDDYDDEFNISGSPTSWTKQFYKIVDSATDTQGVHVMLKDLLSRDVYFRFNPHLTEPVGMLETDKKKQEQLKKDALMYLRKKEGKFRKVAKTLMLKKTMGQQIKDKLQFYKDLMGL